VLHDLANDDGCVALKRAAEDRKWRQTERMSKTCCSAEDTDDDDDDDDCG